MSTVILWGSFHLIPFIVVPHIAGLIPSVTLSLQCAGVLSNWSWKLNISIPTSQEKRTILLFKIRTVVFLQAIGTVDCNSITTGTSFLAPTLKEVFLI